jgi:arylsulfatase A-like enzyme
VTSALDILPTIAELAGVKPPADRTIDGRSLAPLLLKGSNEIGPYFYYFGAQLQAVREGPWKLFLEIDEYPERPPSLWYRTQPELLETHYRLQPAPVLYNLDDDIGETRDVAAAHPDIVARLTKAAQEFDSRLQADKAEMVP